MSPKVHFESSTAVSLSSKRAGLKLLSEDPIDDVTFKLDMIHVAADPSVARCRKRIVRRWGCSEPGHGVCFTFQNIHLCLSEHDVDVWAYELDGGEAVLAQPPISLLSQWLGELPFLPSSYSATEQTDSTEMVLARASTFDSVVSDDASELSIMVPGIGYTAGSAMKGLGKALIHGIERVDTKYREARLQTFLALVSAIERKERNKAVHRVVSRLLRPGKQFDGLMNDILEDIITHPYAYYSKSNVSKLQSLASFFQTNKVRMTTYTRMKWVFLASQASLEHQHRETQIAMDGAETVFLCEFQTEEEAAAEAIKWVTRRLQIQDIGPRNSDTSEDKDKAMTAYEYNATSKRILKFLLAQALRQHSANQTTWTQVFDGGFNMGYLGYEPTDTPLKRLCFMLRDCFVINSVDPNMTVGALPNQKISIWREVCKDLRRWTKHHASLVGWAEEFRALGFNFADLVKFMQTVHQERRQPLRELSILVKLVDAIPDHYWGEIASDKDVLLALPSLKNASDPGAACRESWLSLARQF